MADQDAIESLGAPPVNATLSNFPSIALPRDRRAPTIRHMGDGAATLPHWLREPSPAFHSLEQDLDVEILIVGGGIAGVCLAYTLGEHGAAVGLVESRDIAGAASGRNAGLLTVSPPEPYRELIALWGRDGARAALVAARHSHQRVRSLIEGLGIDCQYAVNGSLRLARTEAEAEDLRASLPDLHADGFRMLETPVSAELPEAVAARFAGAFVTPEDGELDPVRFVRELASAAVGLGARLFTNTPLRAARWEAGLWRLETPRGTARARTLVLCTNAYTPRLCPVVQPLIAPRRGQMLSTAPLSRAVAKRPVLAHWGYQYWRQLADGRLLIGGWRDTDLDGEVGYDERPTPPIQSQIEEGLAELVPEGVTIERRWAGIMGFARDGRPLIGWLDPEHHVAIAAGFTGHGLAWAPGAALELAELLSWRPAPGIASFDPARFPELRARRDRLTVLDAALD
jgi:glycine/D-amino acid oxidase-like deaminating enzyme